VAGKPALVALITGSEAIRSFQSLTEAEKLPCLVNQLKCYFGCKDHEVIIPNFDSPRSPTAHDADGDQLATPAPVRVEYFVYKCWSEEQVRAPSR
jgi:hypothetical protein